MIELSVENVHLSYGDNPVLKGLSMQLKRGEVVSLLGPSGSGKTTLLRAIAGLEEVTKGKIVINDTIMFDSTSRKEVRAELRDLGVVFQSYALWPHKTVFENVAYPLRLRKIKGTALRDQVQQILDQLGLGKLGQRYPHELSGGQQQRVAIGRALVYNPPVLLLDEPLSNLDAKLREEARAFLRELIIRLGLSAILVTHDQSEAMAISDRILLLNNGMIEQEGTPEEMYGSPATLFCAEFMGSNNRLEGTVTDINGDLAQLKGDSGWTLYGKAGQGLRKGEKATAIIRVENVQLSQVAQHNSMQIPLLTSMYLGDRWEYVFRDGSETEVGSLALRAYGTQAQLDDSLHLVLPQEYVWIFPS